MPRVAPAPLKAEDGNNTNPFTILIKSISRLEFALYFALLLNAALPSIHSTVRIGLLGNFTPDNGVNIASQVMLPVFREN